MSWGWLQLGYSIRRKVSCWVKYNIVVASWIYDVLSEMKLPFEREVCNHSWEIIEDPISELPMFQCFNFYLIIQKFLEVDCNSANQCEADWVAGLNIIVMWLVDLFWFWIEVVFPWEREVVNLLQLCKHSQEIVVSLFLELWFFQAFYFESDIRIRPYFKGVRYCFYFGFI